ncbi:GNAT family acetyltransferase, partial [Xanthomonas citri pv. citri]|nr:GNAT family acetyltransferase [Xanthomonas citri pv. citri]
SKKYKVRTLDIHDVDTIYDMSCKNEIFYQYHPPFVTKESIVEDMSALPPNKRSDDKYYIGFFEGDSLVANMDLILGYPADEIAFIGLFMT